VMSQLPCAIFDCVNQLHQAAAQATAAGCFAELNVVLDCARVFPMVCDSPDPSRGPSLAPQCRQVNRDLDDCMGGSGTCSGFGGSNGECGMSCTGPVPWGVKCAGSPAGLSCVCSDGPNAGRQFSMPQSCNSPEWQRVVTSACS
jgi:hypothetical protein